MHNTVNCIKVHGSTFISLLHSVTGSRVPRKGLTSGRHLSEAQADPEKAEKWKSPSDYTVHS